MTTEPILVSIIMTAYNREGYIPEAIESVLNSTYNNWELIITDDGSSDNTLKLADSYAAKDTRIRLYSNPKNLGDYPNRNYAASLARGEFLVFVDSDDWMIGDSLIKWVNVMEGHKASFGIFAHSSYKEVTSLTPQKVLYNHFFKEPLLSFGPVATITRVSYFKKIKGFPELYGPANDMYYNIKAAAQTDTIIFNYPLSNYRLHEGQERNNKYSYLYNNYLYLKNALHEIELPLSSDEKAIISKKNKRRFFTNIIRFYFDSRDFKKTRKAIKLTGFSLRDAMTAVFH